MKIYLVGFMGAGKTTVGRELSARVGAPFFDLDELIDSAAKVSINDLFAQHGVLRSTRHLESAIVATGGGTFTFDENIQFIQSEGLSVYLSAPYSLLRGRIGDKAADPLASLNSIRHRGGADVIGISRCKFGHSLPRNMA